ncbi:protoporphyrinogen oxidase [Amycolatopsis benzoatilytica]|uniref:protoporphyrinogen oxidase n=1 Tax=Amycolatopsis benzoatilytica TaxID=346045 RepID=UPI00037ACCDF|nr:protoporphyrinogen oxidase [Amycolatopsis benzoatilytica]
MKQVAVIGGGISGLAAAYRLRRLLGDQVQLTVFESTAAVGGKLRTAEVGGVGYDVGAEAFLARRPEVLALVEEIGLADRLVHPTKARAKIHAGGSVQGLPPGTVMGVPASAEAVAGVLSEDGRHAVEKERSLGPVQLGSGDVALGPLLRERFGDELVDRLVDPLLGGVYAGGADGLGLRATMPGLAGAVEAGADSLTAAAKSLLPKTPGTAPVFGTLTGGLGGLAERLLELSGARLRTSSTVRALSRTESGWRIEFGAAAPAHAPADSPVDVDAVVLAVPAPAARKLLDGVVPAASAAFGEVELASMAVVAFAFPPGTELPDASGILIGAGERDAEGVPYASKAFTFSSNKWAHLGGDGPVLVRGSVGRFGEPGVLTEDDDALVAAVRADLARLAGVTARPIDLLVTRWGGGLPQYGTGHLDRVARIETAVADVPGLAVAGATLHGVGLPACVATADAAARRIADQLLE